LKVRSEAVYLDVVAPNAERGLIVRLCRHPQEGFAWLWGHVFLDGRVFAFTQHDVPCQAAVTHVEGARVSYRSEGGWSSLAVDRDGRLDSMVGARVEGTYALHESRHAPHGPGPIVATIEAAFVPTGRAVSNLPGRNEVIGEVRATLVLGRHTFEVNGRGQFHEQVQTEPRFTTPFVYGTLRAEDCATVFVRLARGARGHWIEGGGSHRVDRVEISPPGSRRSIVLHTEVGPRTGTLETRYDYSIPVATALRPGTIVTGEIAGRAVSGCINDFLVDRLEYERI
jgi:hypothetical protein